MMQQSKILIVDDRKENLFAMEQILEEVDVEIITVSKGQEALKSTLYHNFALIILDVQMPEMNGYELAKLLRGKKETQNIPIMFLSAVYTSGHSLFQGYRTGAVDFLTKPVEPQIIVNKVTTFVNLDQQKQELKIAYEQLQNTQSQLIQSSKMLALGEMATGVAHEVNQPLQIISISAEVIRLHTKKRNLNDADWKNIDKRLVTIQEMVERASLITGHLRNFGVRERNTEYQKVNVNEVIEESLLLLREQLRTLSIEILTELKEEPIMVSANASQMEQVLVHLLLNARDALKESETKKISIRTFLQEENAVIEVEDSGHGIASDILDKIFNPFFSTRKVGEGTGLGLSTSHSIIQNHQGTLTVNTQQGMGTHFKITLPILREK